MGRIAQSVPVVCSACRAPTTEAVRGRCPRCQAPREQERTAERRVTQPWVRIYTHRAYRRARQRVFDRDDRCCTLRRPGCVGGRRLRAHHTPRPLEQLWFDAGGDWQRFVALACDDDAMATACEPCHIADDARRRAEGKGGRGQGGAERG